MKINKFYPFVLIAFLFQLVTLSGYAQVGLKLGAGIGTKDANAVLDLGTSGTTNGKGLLLPRVALTSKTLPAPFASFPAAGMTVYNTATTGTAPNNVTPGIYYSDGTTWNRNEEISVINGLTKNGEIVELGGTLTKATTIDQNSNAFTLKPSPKASGMTFGAGFNTTTSRNNRIFMPSDGLEIQSNEADTLTKPIVLFSNGGSKTYTNGIEKVRIQSDGKVGIGTKTPTNLLHLYEDNPGSETVLLNLQNNAGDSTKAGTAATIRFSPTNPSGLNRRGIDISAVNKGNNNIDLLFRTTNGDANFVERMRIMSTGEVGIGKATPKSTLDINGTIAVTTGSTTENSVILASTSITLPAASSFSGRIYIIRNILTTNITINSVIDYNATAAAVFLLTATQGAITVISNGTSWYRIQ